MKKPVLLACLPLIAAALAISCGKKNDSANTPDADEVGQQVGDTMASIDESGGSSDGSIAALEREGNRVFARVAPAELRRPWMDFLIPNAYGALCKTTIFNCTSPGVLTKDFAGCTIGLSTITGSVTVTKSNSDCVAPLSAGDTVTRVPAFTITGPHGGTYTVSKTGTIGQRVTKGASSFTFSNDGINRTFVTGAGTTLFNFTTKTTADLTFTGTSRLNRTLVSGTISVTDNIKNVTCAFTPSNVTWTDACNCPMSGSWSGSCGDDATASISLTGCGTATVTVGSESKSVTFDRCYSL
ncbi:MAG: hypothetical protein NDJ89_10485 [Oligoflexia bacterium]|nr:hypothetical protein [Oligoflexia bacterium]